MEPGRDRRTPYDRLNEGSLCWLRFGNAPNRTEAGHENDAFGRMTCLGCRGGDHVGSGEWRRELDQNPCHGNLGRSPVQDRFKAIDQDVYPRSACSQAKSRTRALVADYQRTRRQSGVISKMPSTLQSEGVPPEGATEAHTQKMEHMIKAFWISQIVGTLAKLGIPDHLAGNARAADELASAIACHVGATYRLMRAARTLGLVVSTPDGRFSLTSLGETLRSGVPGSMRDAAIALTARGHWLPWGRLSDAVRAGRHQAPEVLGAELFQYYSDNPAEGCAFTRAMSDISAQVADEIARVIDTSRVNHVVDVGGASGTLIAALLTRNPALMGTILDRPDVVPRAKAAIAEHGLSLRCHVLEGDFFVSVPEADIHLLKHILHDWDDEQSILILSNIAHRLKPNGRVVVIERLIREDAGPSETALVDVNMLVLLPGRERTLREYAGLFARAGLRLARVTEMALQFNVIEASLA
jgi:SAM-dependent methyltransferase